ncbi:MAG: FG-GAP-like repeat-containing protein [bacterium]
MVLVTDKRRQTNALVYATYEGSVHWLDLESDEILWSIGGSDFPFSLRAAPCALNDRPVIFLATAGGDLIAIDEKGERLWNFHSDYPMYASAPGRFDGRSYHIACGGIDRKIFLLDTLGKKITEHPLKRFCHLLAAADFDGDGRDELFVMDGRGEAMMLRVENDRFETIWDHRIQLPESYKNWENWGGNHQSQEALAADIDGDGRAELILGDAFHNRQTVAVVSGDGALRWVCDPQEWYANDRTWWEYFSSAFVTAVPSAKEPGELEIASVAGGLVRHFSKDGKLLGSAESELGFAQIVSDGRTIYLASTPHGDETIYRVSLDDDWEQIVKNLKPQGRAAQIRRTLAEIRKKTAASNRTLDRDVKYDVEQFRLSEGNATAEAYAKTIESLEKVVPEKAFRHIVGSGRILENEPIKKWNGEPFNMTRFNIDAPMGTQTPDEIVAIARNIEQQRIPTMFGIGHNCNPKISLETAERMLQAAPGYLVGFSTAEDVSADSIGDYIEQFIGPLCDLCLKYGNKQVMIKNKVLWWLDGPSMPTIYEQLFATDRRKVIVAATEESNARWGETNLMGRLGMYYAGLVSQIKARVIRDMFAPNNFYVVEYPRSGSPYLRMLVSHAVTGATSYQIFISDKIKQKGMNPDALEYNRLGRECAEIFMHLLGKGYIFPPRPEQMANISSVGLIMHPPSKKWLVSGHNNHRPWDAEEDEEMMKAVYPRLHCGWGYAPLPDFAFSKIAFNKERVFDGQVPATPYGHVLMLPCHFDHSQIDAVKTWWHTDGIYLWQEGGSKMLGEEAGQALRASFEKAKTNLRLQSIGEDVFYQLVKTHGGGYRLYAVDPGWMDPQDRQARFLINMPGNWQATDILNETLIPIHQNEIELPVPAGAFSIVDLKKTSQ